MASEEANEKPAVVDPGTGDAPKLDQDQRVSVDSTILPEQADKAERETRVVPDILNVNDDNGDEQRILSLPPPPSYDVLIDSLSIGIPPRKLYIPTPIPIPIPQVITNWVSPRPKDGPESEGGDERIIRKVSAHVKAGEMMAIIGGSGSGKTTMLHAVANRLGGLPIVEGGVRFVLSGGEEGGKRQELVKKGMITDVVGFVRQNDYLLHHLTGESSGYCSL